MDKKSTKEELSIQKEEELCKYEIKLLVFQGYLNIGPAIIATIALIVACFNSDQRDTYTIIAFIVFLFAVGLLLRLLFILNQIKEHRKRIMSLQKDMIIKNYEDGEQTDEKS